jgi:pimeloyl-ACP methyl ester carboxylesterase/DNA-binding CsgD family transcriptional regulator
MATVAATTIGSAPTDAAISRPDLVNMDIILAVSRTLMAMLDKSEIRFLPVSDRRLAYEVRGSGPPLVAPAWWVSHLELDWQSPDVRRFWEGVAKDYSLIRYDRLGVGMSDRIVEEADLTLDGEVAILCALLDELGLDRVSLIGGSSGSCTAVAFAAAFPERVERVVLYGSYPHGDALTAPGVGDAIVAAVRAHWGLGARMLSDIFLGSVEAAEHERFSRLQRESATADTAAALLDMVYRLDVRPQLPHVRSPTTVVHRRDDRAVPYRLGREVAATIAGATFIPLPGQSHFPWHGDVESVVRACRLGLAPRQPAAAEADQPGPVPLSAREREILACVAHGLGDREIAEQLQLSAHTVHRHVANIRRKLGAASRTAAVAQAARLGLV